MTGAGETNRKEKDDLDLLDHQVRRVGEQPLEGDPPFVHHLDDAGEPRLGEDDRPGSRRLVF